jgi:hypothetical protein
VDISKGPFGINALQDTDFQSPAGLDLAAAISNSPADNWFSMALDESALHYINKTGPTQFRLGFQMDDNDDLGADTIKFYSGDTAVFDYRPILQVGYYTP